LKNQKNKERSCEISIFQTGEARPRGTSAQLLLVLTTFVTCLFVAMVFIEEDPSPDASLLSLKKVEKESEANKEISLSQGSARAAGMRDVLRD